MKLIILGLLLSFNCFADIISVESGKYECYDLFNDTRTYDITISEDRELGIKTNTSISRFFYNKKFKKKYYDTYDVINDKLVTVTSGVHYNWKLVTDKSYIILEHILIKKNRHGIVFNARRHGFIYSHQSDIRHQEVNNICKKI